MSILPSFVQKKQADTTSLKVPAEYGIDFETGQLTGKKVYGLEAIKVWIWLCLQTERYRYQIYSQNYGVSLEQYIGQSPTEDFLNMDCRDEIEEAIMINPYITGIIEFEAVIVKNRVRMKFTVNTLLGEVRMDV
jgi:hypothetical protein